MPYLEFRIDGKMFQYCVGQFKIEQYALMLAYVGICEEFKLDMQSSVYNLIQINEASYVFEFIKLYQSIQGGLKYMRIDGIDLENAYHVKDPNSKTPEEYINNRIQQSEQ